MKRALEWSIRIFWGFFGLYSIYVAIGIAQYRLFHRHPPMDWTAGIFLLSMAFLLATVIFTSYFAVFRFSFGLVKPSVFIVSLILWTVASTVLRVDLHPWIDHKIGSPPNLTVLVLEMLTFPLSIMAAVAFYRATSAALVKMLFPELSRFAARIF